LPFCSEIQAMAAALWKSRVLSGFGPTFGSKGDSRSLETALKRATQSEKVDVSKDDLLEISQSSHHEEDRRMIMRHLYGSLNDASSSKWRCINAGLAIVETLLRTGSPDLVSETAGGMHFDLVQRLSFLEQFEHSADKRVEAMIRRKALSCRGAWLEKQQSVGDVVCGEVAEKKPVVFHSDDTDDDLSDTELERSKVTRGKRENLVEESTTDGESAFRESPRSTNVPSDVDADFMDLLGVDQSPKNSKPDGANIDLLQCGAGYLSSQAPVAVQEGNLLDCF